MKNLKNNIMKFIDDIEFKIISTIYFTGSIIIILNPSPLFNGQLFLGACTLISIAFLSCAYKYKKNSIHKMIKNEIIKWAATGLTFSICMWYAKFKLNLDYEIEPEFLNYSTYGYAFSLTIPFVSIVYGFFILIYIYLKKITTYHFFYTSIITLPLILLTNKEINDYPSHELILSIMLLVIFSIASMKILTNSKNKYKKNIFKIVKMIREDHSRVLLIFNIWLKKSIIYIDIFFNFITLASIAIALIFFGISAIKIIPEHQKSFLLLDAFHITNCNNEKDQFLYIRKSKKECYRLKTNGNKVIEMKKLISKEN